MLAGGWKKLERSRAVAVVIALATFCPGVGSATSYKVLHSFRGADGTGPWGGLTLDQKGNLFGASASGGDLNECNGYGCGVVFELRLQSNGKWTEAVLYRFASNGNDGYTSYGGVTIGSGKHLYGTTYAGGAYDVGTVFKLKHGPNGWAESALYSFGTRSDDGYEPTAGVAMDKAGNLYGTAPYGGSTAFRLSPGTDGWKETVLHRFNVRQGDGGGPFARVILDASGNVYGTTLGGGAYNGGTVYEVQHTSGGWKEKVLYSFHLSQTDGNTPGWGSLLMDGSGSLYGTTRGGGCCGGVVFKLTPDSSGRWKETILYNFQKGATGFSPNAGVVMDKAGNLYGTTDYGGGLCDCGVIYKLARGPNGEWRYAVLHTFGVGNDGGVPEGNLVIDSKGNLYGGTVLGGTYGGGVVFELTP
jgi:uncharacterized repeat protein (TIGR03803 family)